MWTLLTLFVIHYVGISAGIAYSYEVQVVTQDIEQVRTYWQSYANRAIDEVDVRLLSQEVICL